MKEGFTTEIIKLNLVNFILLTTTEIDYFCPEMTLHGIVSSQKDYAKKSSNIKFIHPEDSVHEKKLKYVFLEVLLW